MYNYTKALPIKLTSIKSNQKITFVVINYKGIHPIIRVKVDSCPSNYRHNPA